jgi:DNA-directed RNA polymerase alpha subunit/DNA-directed RNA polymerase subunit L
MNPTLSNISEEGDVYKFTLSGINVSLANAIRRTILSDIPTTVIYTDTSVDGQCSISINNTRLHNEILKQRLSCIPIHITDLETLPGNYVLDLDIQNETDEMIIVTTEHFKVKNKANGNYITNEETRKLFPACPKTNMFIDFARLRPKIGNTIPGERIKLTAEFSVHTAKDNSMFNVVSKCAYGNTPDVSRAKQVWEEREDTLRTETLTNEEIAFQKRNFMILDAQRYYVPDSFDFVIQTLGVYENKDIVKKACIVLQKKLFELVQAIDSKTIPILNSETTIENCYDVILENEDYTLGKSIEYVLYNKYYLGEKIFSFCGFKKFHPHNDDSTLRVAFTQPSSVQHVRECMRSSCIELQELYKKVQSMF